MLGHFKPMGRERFTARKQKKKWKYDKNIPIDFI
jgi:hypothetical protein